MQFLNVGNLERLESVVLNECSKLENILFYTNPSLKSLNVSSNSNLWEFTCFDSGVEELNLPYNIVHVNCQSNNLTSFEFPDRKSLRSLNLGKNSGLTSLDLSGCPELNGLDISDTQIGHFDFSSFPELSAIHCNNTALKEVDVTKNEKLRELYCAGLNLITLNITNNPVLKVLNCSENMLKALDVSKNTYFRKLYINNNQLDQDALETIFKALPSFDPATAERSALLKDIAPAPEPSQIGITGNPGTASCNTKIITAKGWEISKN